jgi:signal transduction histidine kinase
MNVLKNAIEGIQDKGRITVETTAGDGQVTIRIRDDGVGIASDRLKRIFDFGFQSSTTRVKMGTGLSTAYNILQSHKGEIQIESEAGEGTAVTIILPTTR